MGRRLVLLLALAAIPGTIGFCVPRSTGKLHGASRRPLVAGRTPVFARRQGTGTMDAGEDLDQLDGVSFQRRWRRGGRGVGSAATRLLRYFCFFSCWFEDLSLKIRAEI